MNSHFIWFSGERLLNSRAMTRRYRRSLGNGAGDGWSRWGPPPATAAPMRKPAGADVAVLVGDVADPVSGAEGVAVPLGVDELPLHLVRGGEALDLASDAPQVPAVVGERRRVRLVDGVSTACDGRPDAEAARGR